jgi:hypothetical protein
LDSGIARCVAAVPCGFHKPSSGVAEGRRKAEAKKPSWTAQGARSRHSDIPVRAEFGLGQGPPSVKGGLIYRRDYLISVARVLQRGARRLQHGMLIASLPHFASSFPWLFTRKGHKNTVGIKMMSNGQVIGDGSWNLRVFVTDLEMERTLRVKGDLHIGGVMLRLVEDLGKLVLIFIHFICLLDFLASFN